MTFLTLGYTKTLVRYLARLLLLRVPWWELPPGGKKLRAEASSQEGTEVLSPTTHVALNPPKKKKNTRMHLEAGPLSAEPVDEPATQ